ncbi:MAG: HNH endonuclease [Ekhidna sp.]|nr:HNH endonuclease [Ekhidna sp.]
MIDPSADPKIENDIKILKRIIYCSKKQWLDAQRDLDRFFDIQDDYIRILDTSIIVISRQGSRPATPQSIKNQISLRDGEMCVYCGDTEGPFEIDHLWPVVKGGDSSASNLVCACQSCNRSKKDMSLREWMEKEAGRNHD